MRASHSLLLFVFFALGSGSVLAGPNSWRSVMKKQDDKARTRFSISQWFGNQQRQIQMQDLWFAMNAPSPYEFFVGGDYVWGAPAGTTNYAGLAWRASAAAYVAIFGLEVNKEFRKEMWTAIFNLRVFGTHYQGTNITLQGGLRSQENPTIYRSPFVGVNVTIYVGKYFGFEGLYRKYTPPLTNDAGIDTEGSRWEGNVFIDYRLLRVYGSYFVERETLLGGMVPELNNFSGLAAGVKIFF